MAATIGLSRLSTTIYDGWSIVLQDTGPNANYNGFLGTSIPASQLITLGYTYQLAYGFAGLLNANAAASNGAAVQYQFLYGPDDLTFNGTLIASGGGHTGGSAGATNPPSPIPFQFVPLNDIRPTFTFRAGDAFKMVASQYNTIAVSNSITIVVHVILVPFPRTQRDKF